MDVIRALARYSAVPIINAMTDRNHPCEIISDMYSLSKIREEFIKDKYHEEVSEDVIDSDYFAGYQFKRFLLEVQQAIVIYCMLDERK